MQKQKKLVALYEKVYGDSMELDTQLQIAKYAMQQIGTVLVQGIQLEAEAKEKAAADAIAAQMAAEDAAAQAVASAASSVVDAATSQSPSIEDAVVVADSTTSVAS